MAHDPTLRAIGEKTKAILFQKLKGDKKGIEKQLIKTICYY
jgi:hypothetical protein